MPADKEGVEITIYNGLDFGIFKELKITKAYVSKKRVEPVQAPSVVATTSGQNVPDSIRRIQHSNIICDECDAEIFGFRYKCLECADFDLCMSCEDKMHSHHILVRISDPGDALICNRLKLAKRLLRHRRHGDSLASKRHHKRGVPSDACFGLFGELPATDLEIFVPTTEMDSAPTTDASAPTSAKNKKVSFGHQKSSENARIDGNQSNIPPFYDLYRDILFNPSLKPAPATSQTTGAAKTKKAAPHQQNSAGSDANKPPGCGANGDNAGNASASDPLLQGMNKISSMVHNFANMMDPFAEDKDAGSFRGNLFEEIKKMYVAPHAASPSGYAAGAASASVAAQAAAAQAAAHAASAQATARTVAQSIAQTVAQSVAQNVAQTAVQIVSVEAPSTSSTTASASTSATTSVTGADGANALSSADGQAAMIVDCSDDEDEIVMREYPSGNQTDTSIAGSSEHAEKEKSPSHDWTFVEVSDVEDQLKKRMTGAIPKEKPNMADSSASSQVDYAELSRLLHGTEGISSVSAASSTEQQQDEERRKEQQEKQLQQAENARKEEEEKQKQEEEGARKQQQAEQSQNMGTLITLHCNARQLWLCMYVSWIRFCSISFLLLRPESGCIIGNDDSNGLQ